MQQNFLSLFLVMLPVWTEATIRSCPVSWQFYSGNCFKAVFGKKQYNYNRAYTACHNEGGRLASIHSYEELEFLRDNVYPSGLFYIGLKRNAEGDWMYNDTSSYDYSNWEIGEPAYHENCVVLNPKTFKWYGETCHLTVDGALCRKPLGKDHQCFRCKRQAGTIPPSVNCYHTVYSVEFGSSGTNVNFTEPTASDNSSPLNKTSQSHNPGDYFRVGNTSVTYTFSDASGNNANCTFVVTVIRDPFAVTCVNFTDTTQFGSLDGGKNVFFEEPSVTGNSEQVNMTSQTHQPGDFFGVGATKVSYTFIEEKENEVSCSFYVIVQKNERDISPELLRILKYVEVNKLTFTLASVTKVSEELAVFTSSERNLTKDEVDAIATILSDVSNFNSISARVTSSIFSITDNIITKDEYGEDVISANSSAIILQSLERQLENVRESGQNFSETGQNIAVNVVQVENLEEHIRFASLSATTKNRSETYDSRGLGSTLLLNNSSEDYDERVVSIQLDPKALLEAFPLGQDVLPLLFIVHRSGALFQSSKAEIPRLEINSFIIAASTSVPINNLPDIPESLVVTTFLPKNESLLDDPQCMFWNHTLHGSLGGWSGEGCYLSTDDTSDFFSCFCNHLTSFAILVNPYGDSNDEVLGILVKIACCFCMLFLALTIVGISATPNIRSKVPQKIIIHLSVALFGLYFFFLIGVERADLDIGCVLFGALIHFFFLASIAWMSVEATNMYLKFVKIFNADVSNFLWKASLFAWGIPLAVVLISAISSHDSYKSEENCFPHHESLVFYISVFPLVVILLIYNLFIFILIVWKLCSRKNIASSSNTRRDTKRRWMNIVTILFLLGMTWLGGILPIKNRTLSFVFEILFCVLTFLQGIVIFILYCVCSKEVRNTWKEWLYKIGKCGNCSPTSTDLSSQTNQEQFGNMMGKETSESIATTNTHL